jgi:FMNH2-dependent dimethyl sulfone monooxygenase
MNGKRVIKADVFRGPFDPGGQPDLTPRNPIELSLFAWNVRGGLSATKAVMAEPARYRDYWHWPTAKRLLAEADRIGFDYQVQYGMWTGWGGATGWNDEGLDFATAGAASAVVTNRLGLFATVHVGYKYHPMHIAKIGACIDFISEGRWGLNVVAGAIPDDFRKFGMKERPPGATRYAMADEFTTLMKYLWTSDNPVDFEGEHYQCYGGFIAPKPVRKPRPVLMNAGQSDAGFDFACRQADWVFVVPPTGHLEDYATLVEKAHALAAKYGRKVRVGAMCYAVIEADDAAARRTVAWLEEEADREAIFNYVNSIAGTSNEMAEKGDPDHPWAGLERDAFLKVALGMTGYQLFGGYESVAEKMRGLAEVGVDNIVVGFFDPAKALRQMEEHVIPILKRMGLRN